jgi:hypothetical protein
MGWFHPKSIFRNGRFMMRSPQIAIALVCALSAVTVAAADKPQDDGSFTPQTHGDQAAQSDDHADKNRMVCRMETATGSVMPKRVCHTVAEIEALRAQALATKQSLRR